MSRSPNSDKAVKTRFYAIGLGLISFGHERWRVHLVGSGHKKSARAETTSRLEKVFLAFNIERSMLDARYPL